MKIIKQTASELIIQTQSIFNFWLHSCLLMTLGLISLIFDYHTATLICQRLQAKQGKCQIVRSNLLGSNIQDIELASLRGAKVERCGYKTRVVLLTSVGNVPFTANSINWGPKTLWLLTSIFLLKTQKIDCCA
jgi:hypothetical protein